VEGREEKDRGTLEKYKPCLPDILIPTSTSFSTGYQPKLEFYRVRSDSFRSIIDQSSPPARFPTRATFCAREISYYVREDINRT